ncbi:MAG: hypothetical protein II707_03015 [Spirochaetales bacterium]|nr:hypothetical protein [Spirochaetales bacterium]
MSSISSLTYSKVSQINSMMNRFIREATVVKSQMSSSLVPSAWRQFGIGNNVDTFA